MKKTCPKFFEHSNNRNIETAWTNKKIVSFSNESLKALKVVEANEFSPKSAIQVRRFVQTHTPHGVKCGNDFRFVPRLTTTCLPFKLINFFFKSRYRRAQNGEPENNKAHKNVERKRKGNARAAAETTGRLLIGRGPG